MASNLDTDKSGVAIAPEFRMGNTVLDSNTHSYGGIVDYMVVIAPPRVRGPSLNPPGDALISKPPQTWLLNLPNWLFSIRTFAKGYHVVYMKQRVAPFFSMRCLKLL